MWDLATAKAAAGIDPLDATHDAALQHVMDIVIASVETNLGRGVLMRREVVNFNFIDTRCIYVPRYPIQSVHSINDDPVDSNAICIHHRIGRITFNQGIPAQTGACAATVKIDYTGGFDPLPSDLENALWGAFVYLWGQVDPITGLPTASGGGATIVQGSGEISKIVMPDGGSVTWDVGSTVSNGSGGTSSADALAMWGWLAPWGSTLGTYRSESAPSIAFA